MATVPTSLRATTVARDLGTTESKKSICVVVDDASLLRRVEERSLLNRADGRIDENWPDHLLGAEQGAPAGVAAREAPVA